MTQKRDEVIYRRDWPLIVAVVLQLTAFVWFGGKLDNRVEQLEKWVLINENTSERLSVVETQTASIDRNVNEMMKILMEIYREKSR